MGVKGSQEASRGVKGSQYESKDSRGVKMSKEESSLVKRGHNIKSAFNQKAVQFGSRQFHVISCHLVTEVHFFTT